MSLATRALENLDRIDDLQDLVKALWAIFTFLGEHAQHELAEIFRHLRVEILRPGGHLEQVLGEQFPLRRGSKVGRPVTISKQATP